jgi:hypothetical protein
VFRSRGPALLSALLVIACGERAEPPGRAERPDTAEAAAPGPVTAIRVNPGQHGMAAVVRWLRSPDGDALLVLEDWSSTENEPFYDGFLLASEAAGRTLQVDSVWDVAPSPDWSRVAYGEAIRIMVGESDVIPEDSIAAVAARLGVSASAARAAQFPASGMVAAAGYARLGTADLATGTARTLPVLAGWRVRWSDDGTHILAGRGPALADDDAPATGWIAVDPGTGPVRGSADSAAAAPAWVTGPTLDISVTPDTGRVEIPVEGGTIESAGGVIRLRGREIGEGYALAATRRGCYIAAQARDAGAGEYDAKFRLVVYDTGCRAAGTP